MQFGSYKSKKIDFSKFYINKFTPSLYDPVIHGLSACGSNALALLTSVEPNKISKENKFRPHTSDRFMLNFLRKRDFTVEKLTQCKLTNHKAYVIQEQIKPYHVLLLSLLIRKAEASWFVYNNNLLYHNMEITKLRGLDFLNMGISSAYILYHRNWK